VGIGPAQRSRRRAPRSAERLRSGITATPSLRVMAVTWKSLCTLLPPSGAMPKKKERGDSGRDETALIERLRRVSRGYFLVGQGRSRSGAPLGGILPFDDRTDTCGRRPGEARGAARDARGREPLRARRRHARGEARSGNGFGLGLSIAHQGRAGVSRNARARAAAGRGGGTVTRITLPSDPTGRGSPLAFQPPHVGVGARPHGRSSTGVRSLRTALLRDSNTLRGWR
jgi:hypothetical protein